MVQSAAATVDEYLASLPEDRRGDIARVRDVVRANLPAGYEERMLWGMISWVIPLSRYPDTYNKQPLCLAGLASQKHHMALYLMTVYGDPALERSFRAGFKAAGKQLDMGKSCVRFTAADELALDVVADTIRKVSVDDYIANYERVTRAARKPKPRPKAAASTAKGRLKQARRSPKANKPDKSITPKAKPEKRRHVKRR
jgi:uncharacterized protein YdhG (YjbR/CyaY superfamily)